MLGLPQDRFIILFPASSITDGRKGGDQVRSLVRNLRLPGLLFIAMGHGTAEDLGVPPDLFRALGYVESPEKIAAVYAAADIMVAPSSEETFGQIYVEAIASGTPAVGHGLTGTADALLDGITGLTTLATDAESLENAVLALYRDSERRGAMSFWGRVYAENEWSLEACGQHFFSALRRLGLVDALGLAHKISFQRTTSEPEPVDDLHHQSTSTWKPVKGIGAPEGPLPEHGLPTPFQWCLGPKAMIELVVSTPGRYLVLLDCMNRMFDRQVVTLWMDGRSVAEVVLPKRTDDGSFVDAIVELGHGPSQIEISFDKWREPVAGDPRPLAMVLQSVHIIPLPPAEL
jgi:hypothetical protein